MELALFEIRQMNPVNPRNADAEMTEPWLLLIFASLKLKCFIPR